MYIKIDSSLFDQKENFGKIDRIFHHFEDGKHFWVIDQDLEFESIIESEWVTSHLERWQGVIGEFIRRSYTDLINIPVSERKNRRILVIKKDEEVGTVLIDHAISYLNESLYILVENEISDATFLSAMFKNFKSKSKTIRKAIEKNWIQYYNAGGKSMIIKIIEERVKRKPLPIRLFILADSDKNAPDEVNETIGTIIQLCTDNNLSYHILEKREIENYLPFDTLSHLPENLKDITAAFTSLDKTQQDYYSLADGFKKRKSYIFDGLDEERQRVLSAGFNSEGFSPKKELYLLFNHESVSRENLLERCEHQDPQNEFIEIINKITRIL